MEGNDDDHCDMLRGQLKIEAADACPDFMIECCLPASHIAADIEYHVTSFSNMAEMSAELQNEIFAIFEVNIRDFYEKNWGWDKPMKW